MKNNAYPSSHLPPLNPPRYAKPYTHIHPVSLESLIVFACEVLDFQ